MLLYLLSGCIFSLLVILGTSLYHHQKQEDFLNQQLPLSDEMRDRVSGIQKKIGVEGFVVVGVSAFDVFYNMLKVDPYALEGIKHLHHSQGFENIGDLFSFMKNSIDGNSSFNRMVSKYKGYTGEEMAFGNLSEAGADVVVPEAPNYPGLDAWVDGEPINVKITTNPSYINEHLERYPEIKVYTNSEMGEHFTDNPNVIIDSNLSETVVSNVTENTLEGIDNLGDYMDSIPLFTAIISGRKNIGAVLEGRKDISTAIEHVVGDTVAVGVGGAVGGKLGLGIGLLFVPLTGGASMVLIPAATSILGTLMGVLTGKSIVGWWKERHLRRAVEELECRAKMFCEAFIKSYNDLLREVISPFKEKSSFCKSEIKNEDSFLKRIFFPSIKVKFYTLARNKIHKEKKALYSYYKELHEFARKNDENKGGLILYAQGLERFGNQKSLIDCYHGISEYIEVVEKEKDKLK